MDPDMNKYDLTHRVMNHPTMSNREWEEAYEEAWERYYTPEHMHTVLKRTAALGSNMKLTTATVLIIAKYNYRYFGIRTFDGTIGRIRVRHERRPGLPLESFALFHYKNLRERLIAKTGLSYNYFRLWLLTRRLWSDPARFEYKDEAITMPTQDTQEPVLASRGGGST